MTRQNDAERKTSLMDFSLETALPRSEDEPLGLTQSATSIRSHSTSTSPVSTGDKIGRFRVMSLLGEGGYGSVYKAYDEQLQRNVAIKLPHLYRMSSPAAVENYLDEARTLAKLDHPGVVAVHDVGVTETGLPYIVSALITGSSLAKRMKSSPLTLGKALELLLKIAEALSFVHSQGIVHRDVKPGNILLGNDDEPYLADFGLALRDVDAAASPARVGTPSYMSPEQARGESHMVDGRSDIFSLGVVMYEMLTGKRPFIGTSREAVVQNLISQEARPPRQLLPSVPRDLERICLKMLAKRVSDRYMNAFDVIEDIQHFLSSSQDDTSYVSAVIAQDEPQSEIGGVIPRGLRSYERHDADFFHRLLPGPRDREWVPESLRFWQRQVQASGTSDPFRVGVIYGPSGCGKSSFVKAGLLPLLDASVETVFIEATHKDTESRLLRGIRKHCPKLHPQATLAESLAQIRNNPALTGGRRLLLVIDQFEQWLHGHVDQPDTQATEPDLLSAVRQCDGHAIQCLLLVRDDFWLALSRFMALLEVLIEQNKNAMLVDLFGKQHARRVLQEFGVSYGRLPDNPASYSEEQNRFLDAAVDELSVSEKVFPVRLAIFVEMFKSQPWTIGTLNHLGGVDGIGLQFLEEAFSSSVAPAAQATHEHAARRILRKLLPESGVDIKGNMQSEAVLLEASGYQGQSLKFSEMMRILDTDLRLVTPTDPAGTTMSDDSYSESGDGVCYYQLTHDFLVPAIDQWLSRKQRSSRQGRAELRLSEYASVWSAKPSAKHIPGWLDWAAIRFWTSPSRWTPTERKMMNMAHRRHVSRTASVIALSIAVCLGGWWFRQRSNASAYVEQLQTARTDKIRPLLKQLRSSGRHAIGPLTVALDSAAENSRSETVCQLALATHEPSHRESLLRQAVTSELSLLSVILDELQPLTNDERAPLLALLQNDQTPPSQRLQAAIMLGHASAKLSEQENNAIAEHSGVLVNELLRHSARAPQENAILIDALKPIAKQLDASLRSIALQETGSASRSLASSVLVQLLREFPTRLLDFFLDASFDQHDLILPTLDENLVGLTDQIRSEAFKEPDRQLPEPEYDAIARRSAAAAALLHRLKKAESTWPLLAQSEWPHKRNYLIHRIAALGGEFDLLLARYSREPQVSIKRALLFAIGEFNWERRKPSERVQVTAVAKDAFKNDPDAGIHSAAHWLLLRLNEADWVEEETAKLSKLSPDPRKLWYVNDEGITMAILDARDVPEIGYVFEIATSEVTIGQFLRFDPDHYYYEHRSPEANCPANLLDWFQCVAYCRWLSTKLDADPEHAYPAGLIDDAKVPYDDVIRHGAYRLPTVNEWQYACAAMTTSRRFYGLSDELADHYHYYYETSVLPDDETLYSPAGNKKSNDFGMFTMYDGVREWGHEYIPSRDRWSIFGSASSTTVSRVRTIPTRPSADLPQARNGYYGCRVARTVVTR